MIILPILQLLKQSVCMQLALQRVTQRHSGGSRRLHSTHQTTLAAVPILFAHAGVNPSKCIDLSRHAIVLVCSNALTCVNLQTGCVSVSGNVTIQLSGNSSRATGEIIAALTNPRSTNDDVSSDASLSASMTPTVTVSSGATTMSSSGTGM